MGKDSKETVTTFMVMKYDVNLFALDLLFLAMVEIRVYVNNVCSNKSWRSHYTIDSYL